MFLLVASALAGSTALGWPCQRLNWGWRNVWSTCSINSFAPNAGAETPAISTGFRFNNVPMAPSTTLNSLGIYQPGGAAGAVTAVPTFFCANAAATGSGGTVNLRNRCRRAVDAYGSLVRSCASPLGGNRGPVTNAAHLGPDWVPAAGHTPHVSNVAALTQASAFCALPPGTVGTPDKLATPSSTCPGLLGWFTVVFNACGFSQAPALTPTAQLSVPNAPVISSYFPLGAPSGATPNVLGSGAVAPWAVGSFCGSGAASPNLWNPVGATFRTSRCRKALDQFGRTAQRCHMSTAATPAGPAQAGGFSDPLRILAVGTSTNAAPLVPTGMNAWAPLCN